MHHNNQGTRSFSTSLASNRSSRAKPNMIAIRNCITLGYQFLEMHNLILLMSSTGIRMLKEFQTILA